MIMKESAFQGKTEKVGHPERENKTDVCKYRGREQEVWMQQRNTRSLSAAVDESWCFCPCMSDGSGGRHTPSRGLHPGEKQRQHTEDTCCRLPSVYSSACANYRHEHLWPRPHFYTTSSQTLNTSKLPVSALHYACYVWNVLQPHSPSVLLCHCWLQHTGAFFPKCRRAASLDRLCSLQ